MVLQQDFHGAALGSTLASANYSHPPDCPSPWTRVVLELSIAASGVLQRHRVAAVWIDGAEVLRSATPVPAAQGAAFWKVQKDVTRHSALLRQRGSVVYMMLHNSDDRDASSPGGVYSANVSFHFYRSNLGGAIGTSQYPTVKGLYREPADLVLPISNKYGHFGSGFWLMITGGSHVATSPVKIPMNAYRATLEIFASYHDSDENWYTNPLGASNPDQAGNPFPPGMNGGFRQVYATIDDKFVGGHIPFPVIYPGAANPSLWSPVASIGAFDMPSYHLEVTPFLGPLLDGREHGFGLGVRDAQPYWLVTANLHLWVDPCSDSCRGGLVQYKLPPLKIVRDAKWKTDGESEVDAEGGLERFEGWVSSSMGNLTTVVQQKLKFTSKVEVHSQGAVKQVEVTNKRRAQVEVLGGHRSTLRRAEVLTEAPLHVRTSSTGGGRGGMSSRKTRVLHHLEETLSLFDGREETTSRLMDRQEAEGSALMLDDDGNTVVWESGRSRSHYKYRDGSSCFLREVHAAAGDVMMDKSGSCAAVSDV